MLPNGKPENLSPAQRVEIVASFKTRKLVRHILHVLTMLFIVVGLIPYRMDLSLLGLSKGTELGIFLGIAAMVMGISVLLWRCPYCGWHFLWRMDPKNAGTAALSLHSPER